MVGPRQDPNAVAASASRHTRSAPAIPSPGPGLAGGELNSAIAHAVVRVHRDHAGRGPARAQTFFRHNVVVVIVEDAATKAEQSMIADGNVRTALDMRRELQDAMRADLVDLVERLTGSGVVAFMSDNHFEPDLGVELFVLDRWVPGQQDQPA
jgi:uncharacterized protein YbcI